MSNSLNYARETRAELVIRAPEGFEFVDDGLGAPLCGAPKKGQFFLGYRYGEGAMQAVQAEHNYTDTALFPMLRKLQCTVSREMRATVTVSVENVYGSDVTIRKGWRFKAFRKLAKFDFWLSPNGNCEVLGPAEPVDTKTEGPRIIVEVEKEEE